MSVSMVAVAELALSEADWPRFRSVLAEAANDGGWSLRDGSYPEALAGDLTRDGAHLGYKQWRWRDHRESRATLYLAARRDGEGWRQPAQALFDRLAREWPGALRVSG